MIYYLVNKVLLHISSDASDPLKYLSILSYSWLMLTKFQLKSYSNLAQIKLKSWSNFESSLQSNSYISCSILFAKFPRCTVSFIMQCYDCSTNVFPCFGPACVNIVTKWDSMYIITPGPCAFWDRIQPNRLSYIPIWSVCQC